MSSLRISIITPSYNQGNFIEETILSVLNQNYSNLEYIIIDGGSTDNTIEIIKKYENKIAYWISEKDNGQTHAINKGFEIATGDIIAWINSDDVYCDGVLNSVSLFFENNPGSKWLAGNLLFMNKEGSVYLRKYPNSSPWLEKNAMMSIYQPNIFLKKSILTTIGFPREDFHMTMDFEWFCRIAEKFSIDIIDLDFAKFRLHSDSKTSSAPNSKNQIRYHVEALYIIHKYHPQFSWFVEIFPKISLFLWFRIIKFARLIERVRKHELQKLNDVIS
ncbi:glycosyltransferase family 2 protein [Spirosoma flavum]|uniref:Glycosyltransferase family 2 protein n=1 Tax=Spirosoma flavum TaxID=2048557 RepID=A0ABW6ATG1_9BACT